MSSWAKIATANIDKPVKKEVKKTEEVTVVKPTYNIYDIYDQKYGDRISSNITDAYIENRGHNYLFESLGASNLYGFFMKYVDIDATIDEEVNALENDQQEHSESEDEWFY